MGKKQKFWAAQDGCIPTCSTCNCQKIKQTATGHTEQHSTLTLMMPTRVVFIIKMPSVKMEMAWVSLATFTRERGRGDEIHHREESSPLRKAKRLASSTALGNSSSVGSCKGHWCARAWDGCEALWGTVSVSSSSFFNTVLSLASVSQV